MLIPTATVSGRKIDVIQPRPLNQTVDKSIAIVIGSRHSGDRGGQENVRGRLHQTQVAL